MRLVLLLLGMIGGLAAADPLRICASVPDLASIAREVGGDRVVITTFAKGGDDPHFVEARPSFIAALARADLLIEVGLELEVGWLPLVVKQAGNPRVRPGAAGLITAADAIVPLGIPTGPVDRAMGDVHAHGNPHFLLDPVCAVQVARLCSERFGSLRPADADGFRAGLADFEGRIATALVGAEAVKALGAASVIDLEADGTLRTRLTEEGLPLAGWLGQLTPSAPRKAPAIICDHENWPYAARRFGLDIVGYLEPKPGLPPTSRHLADLAELMRERGVTRIVVAPPTDPRPAERLAATTGAKVITVPHQVGAMPGCDTYVDLIATVVTTLAAGLEPAP